MHRSEIASSLFDILEQYAERQTNHADQTTAHHQRFMLACKTRDPGIDPKRYNFALEGRDLALPLESVFQAIRDHYNPRCNPVWDEKKLYDTVCHAFKYAKNSVGSATPESVFTPDMAGFDSLFSKTAAPESNVVSMQAHQDANNSNNHLKSPQMTGKNFDRLKNTLANIAWLLKFDSAWRGMFRYNQFSSKAEFTRRPFWRATQLNKKLDIDAEDIAQIQLWFSSSPHTQLEVTETIVRKAIATAADSHHPVREYLESVVWDGVARLDRILIDTAGVEDSIYARAVGKCTMISAVKRIYEPGSKHDHVLVLEGRQGTGKSTWISVLGGDWYSASELVRADKDTYQNLRGRWFVELPEINSTFRKADFAWLKGVISNSVDVFRKSYGYEAGEVPRESIFIGSINPNAGSEYLKDEENRRYWPINTGRFNLQMLRDNRDQYFAEAVHRYKAGEEGYLTDDKVISEAKVQQAHRQEKDPWIEVLQDYLSQSTQDELKPTEIYAALKLEGPSLNGAQKQRVYAALHSLGYIYETKGHKGAGVWKKINWSELI